MPILDVTRVLRDDETPAPDLAQQLGDAAGHVFGAAAGTVWVTVRALPPGRYADNAVARADMLRPALVRVIKAQDDPAEMRAAEAAALSAALAPCLGRAAALVPLIYGPAGAGRVAFGGRLVRAGAAPSP